jgi:hypothetical protein
MKVKLWIATIAVALTTLTVGAPHSRAAGSGDDVFLDEGDGDFGAPPGTPSASPKGGAAAKAPGAEPSSPVADAVPLTPPASTAATAPADVTAPATATAEEPPGNALGASEEPAAPSAETPTAPSEPAAPKKSSHSAKQASHAHKEKTKHEHGHETSGKAAKTSSSGKGTFMTTKDSCPMMREPASDGAPMIVVKPARKIWVEKVDKDWVRGFNKAGEPGYLSKDCF